MNGPPMGQAEILNLAAHRYGRAIGEELAGSPQAWYGADVIIGHLAILLEDVIGMDKQFDQQLYEICTGVEAILTGFERAHREHSRAMHPSTQPRTTDDPR